MRAVTTYRERKHKGFRNVARRAARDAAVFALSLGRSIPTSSNWIRFPYYHHVFDDERGGFENQLRYMRNYGDFVSIDDAAAYLAAPTPPAGRYFCITFDDGLKNSLTNAAPILIDARAPAAFYVPTGFVGANIDRDDEDIRQYYRRLISPPVEMMTWDECRQMVSAGMTIGSHGVSHTRFLEMPRAAIESELRESKAVLEAELGIECRHFCPPFGMPVMDFDPDRDPALAAEAGYHTFVTGRRGSVSRRPDPMSIDRDLIVAAWPTYQLRYFLSR